MPGERRLGVKQLLMVLYLQTLSMQVFVSFDVTLATLVMWPIIKFPSDMSHISLLVVLDD